MPTMGMHQMGMDCWWFQANDLHEFDLDTLVFTAAIHWLQVGG